MTFSDTQLHALRLRYGAIHEVVSGSPTMGTLMTTVARMSPAQRLQIENADIRWMSPIARAMRTGREFTCSGGHIRDQGRGYLTERPVP